MVGTRPYSTALDFPDRGTNLSGRSINPTAKAGSRCGRHEETRTPDLYRVKILVIGNSTTYRPSRTAKISDNHSFSVAKDGISAERKTKLACRDLENYGAEGHDHVSVEIDSRLVMTRFSRRSTRML